MLGLIKLGQAHFDSVGTGQSIAFTAFALCLIVAAFECRSETESVLTTSTFDSRQWNWVALAQFVLAILVTQMDARQFGRALLAALTLLLLWELGKLLARRSREA
ncbi:cation transporting ATPase C-terminal domain-containing protein [Streptomyces sp. NPDC057575]|uniref:cation transporting ATPase C-terminal domain-containing protein n=1 Tax=Streptomyces sp. NPDC057575 TaxID=3346170 RepID=UPI003683DFFA